MRQIFIMLFRVFSRAALISLTFIFGLSAFQIYFAVFPQTITLCELASHSNWYDGRIVRLNGLAFGLSGGEEKGFILSDSNHQPECAVVGVGLDESYTPTPPVKSFLAELSKEIGKYESRIAEVSVVGRVVVNKDTRGIASIPYGLSAIDIQPKSSIKVERWSEE